MNHAALASAQEPTSQPFDHVSIQHVQLHEPDAQNFYVVTIELADDVSIRVARGGADPDGAGPWQTTLLPVRQIARREHFDLAVNASFFGVDRPTTQPMAEEIGEQFHLPQKLLALGQRGYVAGTRAADNSVAMSDGDFYSKHAPAGWPIFAVEGSHAASIGLRLPMHPTQAISGNCYVLQNGEPLKNFTGPMSVRHPRTALGLNRDASKMFLLVVDGRKTGFAIGMTGDELAAEMKQIGAWNAINLDGGGSTTLVCRDEDGNYSVLNHPSDLVERPVSDALGVTVHPATMPTSGE